MSLPIEDYALIGDCQTAALVGRDGSIDWLCLPRFDSAACFASLLGTPEHGRWQIAPTASLRRASRRYRDNTLVLDTEFETEAGTVTLTDCMPLRQGYPLLVRLVSGKRGQVPMHFDLIIRFDYGSVVPWVRRTATGIRAIAGPDMLEITSEIPLHGENLTTVADFTISEGQELAFSLVWYPSYRPRPEHVNGRRAVNSTVAWWSDWVEACSYQGPNRDAVTRSLITLKALTYAPTGGLVAAPTTSLPEQLGGVRNWDYRYCWVRDATFTLLALLSAGYTTEAQEWREWLLRAVAGKPSELQIMYGIAGERRLTEYELKWLPGYASSAPVRVGNAASNQFQLDVYGELLDAMYHCRRAGLEPDPDAWNLETKLLEFVEEAWTRPDEGIWEVRGTRRNFTHSKVMAWVAVDRGIKAIERYGVKGPLDRWRKVRDAIHAEVCRDGYNADLGAFVQYYGSRDADASLLMIPLVGFLPGSDPRVQGTVAFVERELLRDGFLARYAGTGKVDGLPPGEGVFLACTFWLADVYCLLGRQQEAKEVFERLLGLRNDVGLLSEEYDHKNKRLLGNFPQAFSHIGLVNTAFNLADRTGPAHGRTSS